MDNILKILADNPALFEAVKQAVLNEFDVNTISLMKIERIGDKAIGELVRAQISGVKAVEEAFSKIAKHRSLPNQGGRINEAR